MRIQDSTDITPHQDINAILKELAENLQRILGPQLFGLYLTGSLSYGDFDRGSSDIDFLAILNRALSAEQFDLIKQAHRRIGEQYPLWAARIEGSYITYDMLGYVEPPPMARPYINDGAFWHPDPCYGNEWLLNLYVLYDCGIALAGPQPKTFLPPIDIAAVREASRRDLLDEWKPKLQHLTYLQDSHCQAYVVLTLCRILHRARHDQVASKRVAAAWVKQTYDARWSTLIDDALTWQHGKQMNAIDGTLDFIRFTLREVAKEVDSKP
jgi:hypothetical protein